MYHAAGKERRPSDPCFTVPYLCLHAGVRIACLDSSCPFHGSIKTCNDTAVTLTADISGHHGPECNVKFVVTGNGGETNRTLLFTQVIQGFRRRHAHVLCSMAIAHWY